MPIVPGKPRPLLPAGLTPAPPSRSGAYDCARLIRRLDAWAAVRRDYRLTLGGRTISFALLDDDTLLEHADSIARQERFSRRLRDRNRSIAA